MKSANAPSGRSVDGNILEPDQRDFLGKIESLRMTASSKINSHTDLNMIDGTRDNITVEEGNLLVNEKNMDRQTYAHQSVFLSTKLRNLGILPGSSVIQVLHQKIQESRIRARKRSS